MREKVQLFQASLAIRAIGKLHIQVSFSIQNHGLPGVIRRGQHPERELPRDANLQLSMAPASKPGAYPVVEKRER